MFYTGLASSKLTPYFLKLAIALDGFPSNSLAKSYLIVQKYYSLARISCYAFKPGILKAEALT